MHLYILKRLSISSQTRSSQEFLNSSNIPEIEGSDISLPDIEFEDIMPASFWKFLIRNIGLLSHKDGALSKSLNQTFTTTNNNVKLWGMKLKYFTILLFAAWYNCFWKSMGQEKFFKKSFRVCITSFYMAHTLLLKSESRVLKLL